MKLSTSTNLIAFRPDWVSYVPTLDSMRRLKSVGFDAVDLNISDAGKSFLRLADDDWREWTAQVKDLSFELDLPITQAHAPFYNAIEPESPKAEVWEPLIHRAIEAAGIIGVPWIVMHPGTYPDDSYDFKESKRRNYEYFMPYLEQASKAGVGIAIENMADDIRRTYLRPGAVYCSTHVELVDLVDSFGVDNVGICWDFGHAHLMGLDQREALRYIGDRLKATHVADNSGLHDDHIMPFQGTIDWRNILPVLHEINYCGDLTYEIHNSTSRLPDNLLDDAALLAEKVGRYLLGLATGKIEGTKSPLPQAKY